MEPESEPAATLAAATSQRRGRPRLVVEPVAVNVVLPASAYEVVCGAAEEAAVSRSACLRAIIVEWAAGRASRP